MSIHSICFLWGNKNYSRIITKYSSLISTVMFIFTVPQLKCYQHRHHIKILVILEVFLIPQSSSHLRYSLERLHLQHTHHQCKFESKYCSLHTIYNFLSVQGCSDESFVVVVVFMYCYLLCRAVSVPAGLIPLEPRDLEKYSM